MPTSLANTVIDARNAQPAKLKAWLRDNQAGHRFTDNTSVRELRILVARRQIRLAKKSPRNVPNATMALSLKQFKKHLAQLVERGAGPKEHVTFNAKLVVVDSAMTVLRHSDDCRGVVKGGVCTKCKESTIGEPNFCIPCTLEDLSDSTELYQMTGYKALGATIFGKDVTPEMVANMDPEALEDILEDWCEVPVNVQTLVNYEMNDGKARVSPYHMARLDDAYMGDYL